MDKISLVALFSLYGQEMPIAVTDLSFGENVFRMTLLLGPPGAGKTTLLLALAGKLDQDLRVCLSFLRILYNVIYHY